MVKRRIQILDIEVDSLEFDGQILEAMKNGVYIAPILQVLKLTFATRWLQTISLLFMPFGLELVLSACWDI